MGSGILVGISLVLLVQHQTSFYTAYEDGLKFEGSGQWSNAAQAFERAIALHPAPGPRVFTYGTNLITDYFPYAHLARCRIELGQTDLGQASLSDSIAKGEPPYARKGLQERLQKLASKKSPATPSTPVETPQGPPKPAPSFPAPVPALQEAKVPEKGPPSGQVLPAKLEDPAGPPIRSLPSVNFPQRNGAEKAAPAARALEPAPPPEAPTSAAQGWLPRRAWTIVFMSGLALALGIGWRFYRRRWWADDPDAPDQGRRIGPYQIEGYLGRGGFAFTYKARDTRNGKVIALKLPHPHLMMDEVMRTRFLLEAKLGMALDHPNLVKIVDAGPQQGELFLAMEYIEGPTLEFLLSRKEKIPIQTILSIAVDVGKGLCHAHDHSIVHRDLKPSNILLSKGGAKVVDLGIARDIEGAGLTSTAAFLGTPRYSAPETQLSSKIGPPADWYSYGIILFEMLTGRPPFDGTNPFLVLTQHRTEPLPDPRNSRGDAPTELVDLIFNLTLKDPELRPGGREVLSALERMAAR